MSKNEMMQEITYSKYGIYDDEGNFFPVDLGFDFVIFQNHETIEIKEDTTGQMYFDIF